MLPKAPLMLPKTPLMLPKKRNLEQGAKKRNLVQAHGHSRNVVSDRAVAPHQINY